MVLSAAALVACTQKETPLETAGGSEIKFSASIGNFQVKATDTAFQKGDAIGLFADEPVSASNARLSWDGSALVPDTPLHWGLNQDVNQQVPFYAYYPYTGQAGRQFSFAIPADQTDAAAFAASDLMLASTSAAPKDESVRLNFSHKMARLVILAESHFPGTEVAGVSVSGVVLNADVDITVPSITVSGQATSTVKAAPVAGANGQKAWAVIVPPQNVQALSVSVKLSDGKVFDLPAGSVTLAEGRSYTASVVVDQVLTEPVFSATVTDWLDAWIYIGKEYDPGIQEHTWYVEYNSALYPFEKLEDGTFHQVFAPGSNWAQIRIVKDNYAETWGSAIPDYSPYVYPGKDVETVTLAPNYYLYIKGETDLFDLVLDPAAKTLTIKMMNHEWTYMGVGKFIDGFVSDLFELPHMEIEVDVYQDKYCSNLYRVQDPYKNWEYRDSFDWEEGAYLDFFVKSNGEAWIRKGYVGLSLPEYGAFTCGSIVAENNWNSSSYGFYYEEYGYIGFTDLTVTNFVNGGNYSSNREGMMCLVLPGGTRPFIYDSIQVLVHDWTQDPGQPLYIEALIKPGMDVKTVRYAVYSGHLGAEEVYGKNRDGLCYTDVKNNGTLLDFIPDYSSILRVTVPQNGTYTLVMFAVGSTGREIGAFSHHWTWADAAIPEPSLTLAAEPSEYFPDVEALIKVRFQDPSLDNFYVMAVEDADYSAAGISDSDIFDFTVSNAEPLNPSYISSVSETLLRSGELKPGTTYRILAAGVTNYGQQAWAQSTLTTSPSPGFTSIGKGHYHDCFRNAFGSEGVNSEVEIMQADNNPDRYRVMAPYQEFWSENANSGQFSYAGFSSDYIDCFVDGEKFVYAPYYTGFYDQDMGPVQYNCYGRYLDYLFASNNRMLQEGIFNIAPYAYIVGTRYYYNLTGYNAGIYLEMPGHTYVEPSGAPRRAPAGERLAESAVPVSIVAGSEFLPFTRHIIKTTAIVKAEVTPNFSAEPLK